MIEDMEYQPFKRLWREKMVNDAEQSMDKSAAFDMVERLDIGSAESAASLFKSIVENIDPDVNVYKRK